MLVEASLRCFDKKITESASAISVEMISASHHGQLIKSSTAKGTAKKTIRNTM